MSQSKEKPNFQDITLYDVDTGEPFIFSAKEQEFFWKQGFTDVPKRSPERRKALREQRLGGKTLTKISCKSCKKLGQVLQEVPLKKEVYCAECFQPIWDEYLKKHPELQALHSQD